jgi:hypothetical protein
MEEGTNGLSLLAHIVALLLTGLHEDAYSDAIYYRRSGLLLEI